MNGALVGMSISSDVLILFPFLLYTLYFSPSFLSVRSLFPLEMLYIMIPSLEFS